MKIAFRKNERESPYLWSIILADNSIVCSTERQEGFKNESDQKTAIADW